MVRILFFDEFGNFCEEELQKALIGEDDVPGVPGRTCAGKQRMKRFTPDDLERYFGIPEEKGKEEKDHV